MKTYQSIQKLLTLSMFMILFVVSASLAQKGDGADMENSILKSIDDETLQWGPCPPFMPDGCNIAVLHGDPSKENADVLFRVNGKSSIPNHWHSSAERMVLLSGKMEVTYKGEKTSMMKLGNYAFGPAKKPHTAKCVSKEPCVLFIGFNEPVDAFAIED
jgi:quercetin dioxygenase-like cupin family protein